MALKKEYRQEMLINFIGSALLNALAILPDFKVKVEVVEGGQVMKADTDVFARDFISGKKAREMALAVEKQYCICK